MQPITLTNLAVIILCSALQHPNWTDRLGDKHHAGKLLGEDFDATLNAPRPTAPAEFRAWEREAHDYELSAKERAVVAKCLRGSASVLPASPSLNQLIAAFAVEME